MSQIVRIPFHDDHILAITDEQTGKHYVLPKPMVDIFGLSWQGQLAKLTKNALFSKGIKKMFIPLATGEQEMVILERRLIHPWLLSIDANRVAEHLRAKLLRYQEECADVLDKHFAPVAPAVLPVIHDPAMQMLIDMAFKHDAALYEIACMKEEQARQRDELLMTQQRIIDAFEAAERAEHKADTLYDDAQWVTVRQYIHANRGQLQAVMPPSVQNAYGRWLVAYCQAHNIPIYETKPVGQHWEKENQYPLAEIRATLGPWLTQRGNQLALVPQPEENVVFVTPMTEGV